jgi:hypothetical protein
MATFNTDDWSRLRVILSLLFNYQPDKAQEADSLQSTADSKDLLGCWLSPLLR